MQIIDELEPVAARPLRRRGRLHRLGRAHDGHRHRDPHLRHARTAAPGSRPAPASSPTPIPPPSGERPRPRRGRCCWRWRCEPETRPAEMTCVPAFRLVSSPADQRSFELPRARTLVVGRGLTSDIAIHDPTISRRHAELTAGPDGVQVKDLGSSNGTCINGARVTAGRLDARRHHHLRQGARSACAGQAAIARRSSAPPSPREARRRPAARSCDSSW